MLPDAAPGLTEPRRAVMPPPIIAEPRRVMDPSCEASTPEVREVRARTDMVRILIRCVSESAAPPTRDSARFFCWRLCWRAHSACRSAMSFASSARASPAYRVSVCHRRAVWARSVSKGQAE